MHRRRNHAASRHDDDVRLAVQACRNAPRRSDEGATLGEASAYSMQASTLGVMELGANCSCQCASRLGLCQSRRSPPVRGGC